MKHGCGSINAPALFYVVLSLKNIGGSTLNVDCSTCFIERASFNVDAACKDAQGDLSIGAAAFRNLRAGRWACRAGGAFICADACMRGALRLPGGRRGSLGPRAFCLIHPAGISALKPIQHGQLGGAEHGLFRCAGSMRRKGALPSRALFGPALKWRFDEAACLREQMPLPGGASTDRERGKG